MKKPRGDAKLKTLPDALQEELFQLLRRTTAEKAALWLLEKHAVKTSAGSLSEFFSWYPRSGWLKQAASFSDSLQSTLKNLPQLKINAAQAAEVAQVAFELQAAQNRDPKLFLALRQQDHDTATLRLNERKVKLLEAKAALADEAQAISGNAALTPQEKEQRIKQVFGIT